MKFLRVELERYGHFEGVGLDLTAPDVLLHIVHGPNEAGKSTALAAICDVLFGIEERTPFGFRFDNPRLRLGALIAEEGRSLAFKRRKGRSNTLLAPDETPLPDAALAPFLGGLDRESFKRMFALDHQRLRLGGDAMLAANGDLARSLFEAASGLAGGSGLADALSREADQLGSMRRANAERPFWAAVERYDEATRRQREDLLRTEDWTRAVEARRAAQLTLDEANARLAEHRARASRLHRARRARPILARVDAARSLVEAHRDAPELPADFAERWRDHIQGVRDAEALSARALEAKAEAEAERLRLGDPGPLPAAATEIEALLLALGDILSKERDEPKLLRDLEMGDAARRQLLERLGHAGATALADRPPPRPLIARVRELARERTALDGEAKAARDALRAADERRIEALAARGALGPARDPAQAEAAFSQTPPAAELAKRLGEGGAALAAAESEVARALARLLPAWPGTAEALLALPCPAEERVAAAEEGLRALAMREAELARTLDELDQRWARVGAEEAELVAAGEVPTPEAVQAARDHRDSGWNLIRRRFVDQTEVAGDELAAFDPTGHVVPAFERALRHADALTDRREREAQRIARFASLAGRRREVEAERARAEAARAALGLRRQDWDEAWRALWLPCAITALSPSEMRVWLSRRGAVEIALTEAAKARRALAAATAEADRLRGHLDRVAAYLDLPVDGTGDGAIEALRDRLQAALARARRAWDEAALADTAVAEAARAQSAAQRARDDIQAREAEWRRRWRDCAPLIGVEADASVGEVDAALAVWEEIETERAKLAQTERRLAGLRADVENFRREVADLVGRQGQALGDLVGVEAILAMRAIKERFEAARALAERAADADQRQARAGEAWTRAAAALAGKARAREDLRARYALSPDADPLDAAARGAARVQGLAELRAARAALAEAGDGASEEDLRAEVAPLDPDTLAAAAAAADEAITAAQTQAQAAAQDLAKADEAVARMTRAAGVGDAAQAARDAGVEIVERARSWMVLKAAAAIYTRAIDRYRAANEHPLVRRASELMARIAGHGDNPITGLKVEYGAGDLPVIAGVRRDASLCPVEGMSEGTRDQLFLALKIAALERFIADGGPAPPFIADDLFITSDETRTRSGLLELAELGRATQVLLFTHHRYVRDAAVAALGPRVAIHELGMAPLAP